MNDDTMTGIVVIGRNEGHRLERCLKSVMKTGLPVVYVDSKSEDGSVEKARQKGVDVVELDEEMPLTAARGRNEGLKYMKSRYQGLKYVQFVDGDCQLQADWVCVAVRYLEKNKKWAAVCGRLQERDPKASIYCRLCNLEWDRPIGPAEHCGGIFMVRVEAFDTVGGFDATLEAGEEPELCKRLHAKGWQTHRVDMLMAVHDAGIYHFGQWWKRVERTGQAYQQMIMRKKESCAYTAVKAICSALFWAVFIPIATMTATILAGWHGILLLLLYPLQIFRVMLIQLRHRSWYDALLYACACMVSKWPQCTGMAKVIIKKG